MFTVQFCFNLFVAPEWNRRRPEWWHRVTPNWEPSWACVLLSFAQNCHFNDIKINSQVPKKANLKLFAITCLCSQFALTRSLYFTRSLSKLSKYRNQRLLAYITGPSLARVPGNPSNLKKTPLEPFNSGRYMYNCWLGTRQILYLKVQEPFLKDS